MDALQQLSGAWSLRPSWRLSEIEIADTAMNLTMSKTEFEQLPFRDDLVNEPIEGAYFRDYHHPREVFKAHVSGATGRLWCWECFGVDFD